MTIEEKRSALIVHENGITASRVRSIMSQRGWVSEICDDGDRAVDLYIRLKPKLVFLGLNLPTIDGHVAALEIRERDPEARIIFVVSKSRLEKANDAAYSSGAVAVLTTPITRSDIEQKWIIINGPIPEAPGLADLDELYPELDDEAPHPQNIETALPDPQAILSSADPPLPIDQNFVNPKKKGKTVKILILLTILSVTAILSGLYFDLLNI
ncbi:MAG: response regulator [Candidatus Thermoplasmatota archaeon]|nr:response regulator [Candidatus Thermoplasmatota archaeon]